MAFESTKEVFVVVNTEYVVDMLAYHSDENYQAIFQQNAERLKNFPNKRHVFMYFAKPLSVERTVFRLVYDWKRWREPIGSVIDQHRAFENDFQTVLESPDYKATTSEEEIMRQRLLGRPLLMVHEFERFIKRATHFNRLSSLPKDIGAAVLARATSES